jgi:hypothetical protein
VGSQLQYQHIYKYLLMYGKSYSVEYCGRKAVIYSVSVIELAPAMGSARLPADECTAEMCVDNRAAGC